MQQGAGLHVVQARDRRELRPRDRGVRRALEPVHDLPLQPLWRHAREPDHQVHERLFADAREHHVPLPPHHLLHHRHLRHLDPPRARVRGHPHGATGRLRHRLVCDVQENPLAQRGCGRCAEHALGRTVGCRHQHPRRQDLRARGLRARAVRPREPRGRGARHQAHDGLACTRNHHRMHRACHHVVGGRIYCRRQRMVRHHAGHARHHVHVHLHHHEPVQLHQPWPAALQRRVWRRLGHDQCARRAAPGGRRAQRQAAQGDRRRHRLQRPELLVHRRQCQNEGVRQLQPAYSRRSARRPRGQVGCGQDDAHQAFTAPVRHPGRRDLDRRAKRREGHAAEPAPASCLRPAGGAALPPHYRGEHRLRPPGRLDGRDTRGGAPGKRARVHRAVAAGL